MSPEELELRTMRNTHLKYIKMIRFTLDNRDSYNYDEEYKIVDKILDLLNDHDYEVSKTKFKKSQHEKIRHCIVQKGTAL